MVRAIETDSSTAAGDPMPADAELCDPASPRLQPRALTGPTPLSLGQERLWFLDQINPGDLSANLSSGVRLRGPLNRDILQQALEAVAARHEILRTTFANNEHYADRDGQPLQFAGDGVSLDLTFIDLSKRSAAERETAARGIAKSQAQTSFDLSIGPLFRPVLVGLQHDDHILLLNTHRMVADEASLDLFYTELWDCYQGFLKGDASRLTEVPLQFADYAIRQREWLQSTAAREQLEFWRATLAGAPALLELPLDTPRPPLQTTHGSSVSLILDRELTEAVRALAQSEQSTTRAVLLAGFQVVLARHTRRSDIVVGLASENRHAVEVRALLGPVADVLVLRTELSGNPTFLELLSRTAEKIDQANAHKAIPFAKLLSELPVDRSLSHAPVFQILINHRESGTRHWQLSAAGDSESLAVETFAFDSGISPFDLTLDLIEAGDQIRCRLIYNTDLFAEVTTARLLKHFEVLLEAATAKPNLPISELPLLSRAEREQLLFEWNETQVEYPSGCVHQLFETQVEKTPVATALLCGSERLSYRELNARANQLANYLRRLGVGPDTRVAICLERSIEMVIAVLATLKAGAAYVPLDPAYPSDRLTFTLQDAAAFVVLTQEKLTDLVAGTSARIICVDLEQEAIAREAASNPVTGVTERNLAYVIYTSGSTGQPKGVAIEHTSTVCFLHWAAATFTRQELSGVLQSTSICFDLSVFELFAPLSVGGKVILVDNALALARLDSSEVTLINTVPSAMTELVNQRAIPASVLAVNLAGEPLRNNLVQAVYREAHIGRVLNLYGPSEDTTYSTFVSLTRGAVEEPTIGRPVANTMVYLLDANLQPAPPGVPGELFLGGAGLARGYLNRSDQTAERFVPDPFGKEPGARLYRTGDLARYRYDGNLEFLGRIDQQVKIRGFRIEPGEIEALLRTHACVRDAAVQPNERHDGLVAYVVVERSRLPGEGTISAELKKHLGSKLPDYMLPSIFVELDALPLTPNGKIDRRALKVPTDHRPTGQAQVAPRNEVEATLVQLWQKVLGRENVGVTDNFFELGGHSLLASRLFAQIQNTFGRHLPLSALFQSPTIEQLAHVLHEPEARHSWSSLVAIQPKGSRPPLFCVHAAGANVLIYRPLARHLGLEQPVYALQAQGLDGQSEPLVHVEEMAALYIKEMRALQPDGPYYLLGASFGGLVIYEMAQQLSAQGQKVELLVMLNTDCPVYSVGKRIRCHLGNLREKGVRTYLGFAVRAALQRFSPQVADKVGDTLAGNKELQAAVETRANVNDPLVRTVVANLQAEQDYRPAQRRYKGRIIYFWARDAERDFADNRAGWRQLAAGDFELHVVPGDHSTMREEPNISVLVEKLRPALSR